MLVGSKVLSLAVAFSTGLLLGNLVPFDLFAGSRFVRLVRARWDLFWLSPSSGEMAESANFFAYYTAGVVNAGARALAYWEG